jgi:SP family general alpha glucoside:H+ symporter-like MFS transporter
VSDGTGLGQRTDAELTFSRSIMEGYDIVLVTSLFAQPAFAERYGSFSPGSGWQITASWQSALGIAPMVGAILGAFLNGYLALKFGYRKVLLVALVAMTAFIFLLFFANSLGMLLAGLILCGVPWGVFATMAPAYASEAWSVIPDSSELHGSDNNTARSASVGT